MKRKELIVVAGFCLLVLPTIALVQQIFDPDTGLISLAGKKESELIINSIERDRPEEVGNTAAERLLMNVETAPSVPKTGSILLQDDNFSAGYDEIYDNRDDYYGREIEFSGFVITNGIREGQFLLGRNVMWCCAADAFYIGFLVIPQGERPPADSDIRIKGVLEPALYTDPDSEKTFTVPAVREVIRMPAPKYSRDVFPR